MALCGGSGSHPVIELYSKPNPPSATASPSVEPPAGSAPSTASPTNTAVIPEQLLVARFNDGAEPFSLTSTPQYSFTVENGTYRIRVFAEESTKHLYGSYAHLKREAEAVAVLVDVEELTSPTPGDDLVGVACANDEGHGYFLQATEGFFFLATLDEGGFSSLASGAVPDSVTGPVKQLKLTCKAGTKQIEVSGWINGVRVVATTDDSFDSFTTIALRLAADRGTEARFDNVTAYVPTPDDL